ncbi:23S rRNA m(5)U-747 methyltransferase [Paramicrobacterium humi]|uniref:23S rRNA m(5)U-747 methyltransferase n=1 Tax=Paramicrobacterium humi TaxID=640635 RepID=A0A1H4Q009_9MICO|nr:23S rRNA (uracil(747)-C(5))-methyltransferase RlmC [Microbacterium humi]SEC12976.1 23S rRNA m(5)U-747 methyltransferase [Microbacterium humi]
MQCAYFDAGACRSCTLMGEPYEDQLATKDAECRRLLERHDGIEWLPPVASAESGFRTKAKMVVGGSVDAPTLGIMNRSGRGVDLRECGIISPGILNVFPALADFITQAAITPYDVPARRGELKHLIVTESSTGALMLRFVLRSQEPVARIRKHLPGLRQLVPRLQVVSVNIQPEHKAVLEGEREIVLTDAESLRIPLGSVELNLRAKSFVQTNTQIATALYAQVRGWVEERRPESVWDLYCGVGGFALNCAHAAGRVTGVELSEEAIVSASLSAQAAKLTNTRFVAGDATTFAERQSRHPDLVIVNPPRRGIGDRLAAWLERSSVPHVVYSSCNAVTLASDLDAMPSLRPVRARVLDMFPQSGHYETAVLLERA